MELIGGLEPPTSLELLPNDRNDNVISHTVNYNNKGKDRYIIAGMGTVESASSVLGAMIESYPNNKNYNYKIYLYEVAIKKKMISRSRLGLSKMEHPAANHLLYIVYFSNYKMSTRIQKNHYPSRIVRSTQ